MTQEYDEQVLATIPVMTGSNGCPALHQIHVFLLPVDPDEKTIGKYNNAVQEWNEVYGPAFQTKHGEYRMKACHLSLIYRDADFNDKEVRVMQSAIYCRSNSREDVIAQSHTQALFFSQRGFNVVREKIGTSISDVDQITFASGSFPTSTYFEFCIKIQRNTLSFGPIRPGEIEFLKEISNDFTVEYRTPIAFCWDYSEGIDGMDGFDNYQRSLNGRFRSGSVSESSAKVNDIVNMIHKNSHLDVVKTISKYVWYDTYNQLDAGWIDFSEGECEKFLAAIESRKTNGTIGTILKYVKRAVGDWIGGWSV
jgi:hypothetical protein